jgi:hypothetical protein
MIRTAKSVVARAGAYEASLRMTKAGLGSLYHGTTEVLRFTATSFSPVVASPPLTDAALDLGTALLQYRDLYLSRDIVNSGGFYKGSVGNALTAHAGGTQAAALALTKQFNFISVCATAGDSVRLPASVAGMSVFIWNGGAAAAQVFGAGTDTINGIATATGVPLPINRGAWYNCNAAGTWLAALGDALPVASYNTETNTTNFTTTGAKVAGAQNVVLNLTGALGSGQNVQLPTAAQDRRGDPQRLRRTDVPAADPEHVVRRLRLDRDHQHRPDTDRHHDHRAEHLPRFLGDADLAVGCGLSSRSGK